MLIRPDDRETAPAFFAFLDAEAPRLWDDATIGAFLDAESGVPARYAKGFLGPGESTPVLVLRALGHRDALFEASVPAVINLDVALVGYVDRNAAAPEARRLALAAFTGAFADFLRPHAGLAQTDPPAAARAVGALCGLGEGRPWHTPRPGESVIEIAADDIDALARLAEAEAGVLAPLATPAVAYGSIVDTVLNRVAARAFYGPTIQAVIDRPHQFEPVPAAGWRGMHPAPPATVAAVRAHLVARMRGAPSLVGTATHFLNPVVQGRRPNGIPAWAASWRHGHRVGPEGGPHVHYHINPPGDPKPKPYALRLD